MNPGLVIKLVVALLGIAGVVYWNVSQFLPSEVEYYEEEEEEIGFENLEEVPKSARMRWMESLCGSPAIGLPFGSEPFRSAAVRERAKRLEFMDLPSPSPPTETMGAALVKPPAESDQSDDQEAGDQESPEVDPSGAVAEGNPGQEIVEVQEPDLQVTVQLVMVSHGGRVAVVDGGIVRVGDLVRGFTVQRINHEGVWIEVGTQDRFFPLVSRRETANEHSGPSDPDQGGS